MSSPRRRGTEHAFDGGADRPRTGPDATANSRPDASSYFGIEQLRSIEQSVGRFDDPTAPPEQLGDFKILREIGRGAMGVVYEAVQLSLERRVALKVLPREMTSQPVRMKRFEREAKALAALDHANIVTIHTVESVDDVHFLTMELVEGQTLDELIPNGGMSLSEALEISVTMADALDAAHQQGIIHRDLKPANVMITTQGHVKILDFGLAKLRGEVDEPSVAGESETTLTLTENGTTLGTVPYMSPEQVEGRSVDSRSDLFSFGVILYLITTGRHPFRRRDVAETMSAILHEDPLDVTRLNPRLPQDLGRIVQHCLRKDADHRFQTVKGLRNELEELRESLDLPEPELPDRPLIPLWLRAVMAVVVSTVAILVFAFYDPLFGPERLPDWAPSRITTAPEWDLEPAISPDGRDVAFVSGKNGDSDIWLMDAGGGRPLRRTTDPAHDTSPAWLPDGRTLVFVSDRGGTTDIWKLDRFAGPPTQFLPNAQDPAVSMDGSRIAFVRPDATGSLRLFVAPLDQPDEVVQLTHEGDGADDHRHPAWSHDDETIVYNGFYDLWRVPAAGGGAQRLTDGMNNANHATWSPSGWIYFHSHREQQLALWRMRPSGNRLERVTGGTGFEYQPSLSRDGSWLVHSTRIVDTGIVLLDLATGERSRIKTAAHNPWGAAFSPDGQMIVFCAKHELWTQRVRDGELSGEPSKLIDHPGDISLPVFSPDGSWIVYSHVKGQERDIWIVASDGGVARRLTQTGDLDLHGSWSPDGSRIVFASDRSGEVRLWIAGVENGRPSGSYEQLTEGETIDAFPKWSPDGSSIAFVRKRDVWLVRPGGGEVAVRVTHGADARLLGWNKSNGALLVSGTWGTQDVVLKTVDVETARAEPVPHGVRMGNRLATGDFDISPDGRLIAYELEGFRGDIWLLNAKLDRF